MMRAPVRVDVDEISMTDGPAAPVPVKLIDVARHARVSAGTVSNVLNKPDRVRGDLRLRVEHSIRELGYVGSRVAGQLKSGRSSLVGVVLPDVGNPFWADLLRGVEMVLDQHRYTLVVASSRLEPAREKTILQALESHQVDGLILAPARRSADVREAFLRRPFGVVSLERQTGTRQWASVSVDDVRGGEMAAEHLLKKGYRRLILVSGTDEISWPADRRTGVKRALTARGLPVGDWLTEITPSGEGTASGGRDAAGKIAALAGAEPAGVICGNDLLALGVLRGLQDRGLRVPEDFALVGYDDVEFASALSPSLTSVRQPSFDMGAAAARLLINNASGQGHHVSFEPELVVRGSTALTISPRAGS